MSGRPSGAGRGKKLVVLGAFVALMIALFLIPGGQKTEFDVAEEFELTPIVELPSIGPVDLSITKPVLYLWLTVGIIVVLTIVIARSLKPVPSRFQEAMEALYELARDGIARSVMRKGADTWFPYIGGAFFFILFSNLIGLIPLPLGEHHALSFYAATGNLYVTATLALFTFVFTHYAGIKAHGLFMYTRSWAPPSAPPVLKQFIWFMHAVSEVFRLVSLSVRLFANMLAGHAILAVFFAMALIFQNYAAAVILQGGSVAIYLFEIFVAFIQAFIFASLSAVYIGGAIADEH
jgi:F-type H+-transporting ATPase subunit a